MRSSNGPWWIGAALLCAAAPALAGAKQFPAVDSRSGLPLARVPAGTYAPLYAAQPGRAASTVAPFMLMSRPVTNADFAEFVHEHAAYRRDAIARGLADAQYLAHWASAGEPGAAAGAARPVTLVSWFAAKAFCESRGLRLPTEAEWEVAAAASETRRDGAADRRFRQSILRWYSTPNGELPDVPHGRANVYGIHDLHGVIWEWVSDFTAAAPGADAESGRFCGSAATAAGDNTDYPAFMRAALRSSLKASYTLANLGFRCAADVAESASSEPDRSGREPEITWTDQRGGQLSLAAMRGHPLVTAMFYASCTTVCPMLIEQIKQIDAALSARARAQTRIVLISLDPERDTTERLAELAKLHGIDDARWHFARTSNSGVGEMAARLGVAYQALPGGGFGHSSVVSLLDGEGALVMQRQAGTAGANDLAAAIERLAAATSAAD